MRTPYICIYIYNYIYTDTHCSLIVYIFCTYVTPDLDKSSDVTWLLTGMMARIGVTLPK